MNVEKMRQELSRMYGDSWSAKVAKMSDGQVVAVYRRLQKTGQIKL